MNPNPVIELDANGIITFANEATHKTLKALGIPENPALFVPDDKEEILRLLRESAELQVYKEIKLNDAWFSENIALNRGLRVVRIYVADITEHKRAEEALRERLKELNCLYDMLALLELPGISLDEILKRIILLLPPAWQFPEITEGRIVLEGQTFQTARFRESSWMLAREILVHGNPVGQVEVCYLEERQESNEGPFMTEERLLLNTIAERIGHIIERKRMEEALAESEEFNKSIIKNSLDCIKILDTQGNLRFMSESGQKLLEICDINQYIGKSWIDFWTGRDQKAAKKAVLQAAKGDVGKFTGYCLTEKGTPKWWDVVITPIKDQAGEVIKLLSISRDITERKRADEALLENERKLQEIVHGSPIPQFVIDKDHCIINWNRALEEYSRIKADEVLGTRSAWKAFYDKERPVMADLLLDGCFDKIPVWYAGKYDQSKYVEGAFEATDFFPKMGTSGVWLHFTAAPIRDSKGTIIGAIETLEDVTERKQAEEVLKKMLSLLNASLESTADGILVVDQQGRITSYNQNFINMWNIPLDLMESRESETVMNHVLSQLKNPEGFLASIQELHAHPARESFDMIEFNDGKIFERYSKPQKIGDSVVGRVWSFRDITDRKHAEEKLVASIQEKEVLLREIHHRVKNNLQLISGLLDMTRMRTVDESTNSILTDMMLKIQTMAQIHTRLYESRQFGKISITGQFRDQVAALSNIYSHKGHEISCEIHSQEVFLPVDQAIPCALVVNEILSNAYKHAFKGRKHGTIEISAVQENGQIRITVRDDGIGMPAHFDISRSNSLGLKLIRTLVQHQLKGSIIINGHHGTEIIIEFPIMIAGT
jgi:PAS domain S-box-containing protein